MRLAQFEIPAVKGDSEPGEFVVFFFQGGGGGVDANLSRWIDQFDPKGRKANITRGKSTQGNYYLADITGAFNKPVGPPVRRRSKRVPGSRALAAILQASDGNYYIKLTGPEKTVSSVARQYRAAFGGKAADEKQYKLAGRR